MVDEHMEEKQLPAVSESPVYIRKSNTLITAKFKLPMLCHKLMSMSLNRLEPDGLQMKAVLYPSEIRALLGAESDSNIYKKLKKAAALMEGTRIFTDRGNGEFESFVMVTNSKYANSTFEILYNKQMTPYLESIKKNYTRFELSMVLGFEKPYSYRLYEILKKDAWRLEKKKTQYIVVTYGLHELRGALGLIDTNQDYIRKAVDRKAGWDEIAENICKKEHQQFKSFRDFKKRVLDPAKEEIQALTDIRFEYSLETHGRGGKVHGIRFQIFENDPASMRTVEKQLKDTAERFTKAGPDFEQLSMDQYWPEETIFLELRDYLTEKGIDTIGFTQEYFKQIYKAAGEDPDAIKAEIDYSKTVPEIKNYYGWLRQAVKEHYSQNVPVPAVHGSTKEAEAVSEINSKVESDDNRKRVWEKYIKNKEDFRDFVRYLCIPEDQIEEIFTIEECINEYVNYRKRK